MHMSLQIDKLSCLQALHLSPSSHGFQAMQPHIWACAPRFQVCLQSLQACNLSCVHMHTTPHIY